MINSLFFDMGGTIFDFHKNGLSDSEKENIGIKKLEAFIISQYPLIDFIDFTNNVIKPFLNYDANERKLKLVEYRIIDSIFEYFYRKSIFLESYSIINMLEMFYSDFSENAVLNDGIGECLAYYYNKGKKIIIVSNAFLPDEIFVKIFKKFGIDDYIHDYVFSYSNYFMKPHKSMFFKALLSAKSLPENTLMIGDNQSADIQGAKNLGIQTCFYNGHGESQKVESDYEIKSFYELIALDI